MPGVRRSQQPYPGDRGDTGLGQRGHHLYLHLRQPRHGRPRQVRLLRLRPAAGGVRSGRNAGGEKRIGEQHR